MRACSIGFIVAILIAACGHDRQAAPPPVTATVVPAAPPPVDLRRAVIDAVGHIVILKMATFGDYRDVVTTVRREPGVVSVEPFAFVEITLRRNGHVATAGIKGIALDRTPLAAYVMPRNALPVARALRPEVDLPPADFTRSDQAPTDFSGTGTPTDVVIGATLARTLDAHLGDLVESDLAGVIDHDTWETGPPRHRQLRVVGVLTTNSPYDDQLLVTTLEAAQEARRPR